MFTYDIIFFSNLLTGADPTQSPAALPLVLSVGLICHSQIFRNKFWVVCKDQKIANEALSFEK